MTGTSSGLGIETARTLAAHGAYVVGTVPSAYYIVDRLFGAAELRLDGDKGDKTVDAMAPIPYMLEAFMAGDRGFRRGGAPKPGPQKPIYPHEVRPSHAKTQPTAALSLMGTDEGVGHMMAGEK